MKNILILIFFIIFQNIVNANVNDARIYNKYININNSYQLYCEYNIAENQQYSIVPITETKLVQNKLQRSFIILFNNKTFNLNLIVESNEEKPQFELFLDYKLVMVGEIEENFGKNHKKKLIISNNSNSIFKKLSLNLLNCYVEFAIEQPIVLNSIKPYHISVHPHGIYDYKKLLTENISSYLSNKNYLSMVLLEDGNFKENLVDLKDFLNRSEISLPINDYKGIDVKIPTDVPLYVSPSGHNRYVIENEVTSVLYTGGNHNYCIWNNTRNLVDAFMRSKVSSKLHITYDTKSIVLQCGSGIIRGLGIWCWNLRKSNLLEDYLASSSSKSISYHKAYFSYFLHSNFLQYTSLFNSLEFEYRTNDFIEVKQLRGTGLRDLKIIIDYK